MAGSRTARAADRGVARIDQVVEDQLRRRIAAGTTLTVGLSGGIDSVVLLDVLRREAAKHGVRLAALHVNHGLSPHAHEWERFCRDHCRRRHVPLMVHRVHVEGGGSNVEANARAARYRAYAQAGAGTIALAHHRDDQAETVLLRLLRGSGVLGLSGMQASSRVMIRADGDAARELVLFRPLLCVEREDLEAYARRRRLAWIEDESNRDERYARNFLRARVLPALEARFPNARAALARSGAHLAQAAALIAEFTAIDSAAAMAGDRIDVACLQRLGALRAANVVRAYLAARGEPMPSTVRLGEILRQLCDSRSDAAPLVRIGALTLRRYRGWIMLDRAVEQDSLPAAIDWHGQRRLVLPGGGTLHVSRGLGLGVSAAKLRGKSVQVRFRRGGERMRLEAHRPSRTLKNLLQEAGVPPWQRERMPLVYCAEALVWVPPLGVDSAFRAAAGERAVRFRWEEFDDRSERA